MKKFKKILLVIGLFFLVQSAGCLASTGQKIEAPELKDLTILVSSTDDYAELWEPFCKLLFTYWPSLKTYNSQIPIVLITDERSFSFPGIINFKGGKNQGWSKNMKAALSKVTTKYVLYLQESYFLSGPVDEKFLSYLFDKMKENKIPYIELSKGTPYENATSFPAIDSAYQKDKQDAHLISTLPALWEKDELDWLLKDHCIWGCEFYPKDFAYLGSVRAMGSMQPFLFLQQNYPITFVKACHLGFWDHPVLEFLKTKGISVANLKLPIDKDYVFTLWLKNNLPGVFRRWVKVLRCFDPKFKNRDISRLEKYKPQRGSK
ncbi:MAG: hypothetical protein WCG05_03430 [Alphaproteobacteria bacterium]